MNSLALSIVLIYLGLVSSLASPAEVTESLPPSPPLAPPSPHYHHLHHLHHRPETIEECCSFLVYFGYCDIDQSNYTEDEFRSCLTKYQRTWGLEASGDIDEDTKNMMGKPRCGNTDHGIVETKSERYVLTDTKWNTRYLTYVFQNYPDQLPEAVVRSDIKRAFQSWMDVCDLKFAEVSTPFDANIKLLFVTDVDGRRLHFDGPGGTLAHASLPPKGKIHFDNSESFNTPHGFSLYNVALHEIGHAIGLLHFNTSVSVMNPTYSEIPLYPDDIRRCQVLYGAPKEAPKFPSSTP